LGASLTLTIPIYALFNLVAALASYPAGFFSDRVGRKVMLLAAFLVFLIVYAGFGITSNTTVLGCLFVFYGFYQGIFRAVGKALASDLVPPQLRASGVGWNTATIGITGLFASVVGGELWMRISPSASFFFGAASALLGSAALVVLMPQDR
jgi:MFS family permease